MQLKRTLIHHTISIFLFAFLMMVAVSLHGQGGTSNDYMAVIEKADDYFDQGDYINAKSSYQYASRMNPDEQYPKDRLQLTVNKLREKMARMDDYTAVIIEADNYFRQKEYDKAVEKYREANSIMSAEGYPDKKIREIEEMKNSAHRKQVAYDDAIYRADKFVKYRKYEEAIAAYNKALEYLPTEAYPREKIAELEAELEGLVEARKAYDATVENADRLFSLKYYEQAKQEYEKASEARPEDEYPKSMIADIDKLLVKKNEFDGYVNAGDEFYMNKQLAAAKEKYQQALSIYPAESYPKDMISKINASLKDAMGADELYASSVAAADGFLKNKDYTNALQEYKNAADLKPGESYPKEKIAAINAIYAAAEAKEQEYAASVKNGDQYFSEGAYKESREQFARALELKPGEQYPTDRLAEVNKLLAEKAAIMASYQQSVDKADAFFTSGEYEKAKTEYQNALVIIPADKFATARLSEIERLKKKDSQDAIFYSALIEAADQMFNLNDLMAARLKYEEAMELNPEEEYPALQVERIDQMLKKQQEATLAYNKAIATADIYYNKKEYSRAQSEYEKAAILKPNDSYAKNRLAEISGMTIAVTTAIPQGDEYTDALKEADGLMGQHEYAKARLVYIKASNMRPREQYPKDKMEEIDRILGQQETDQAEYNRLIAAADRMMESADYAMAKERYQQALLIYPMEQYPQDQLKEIESRIVTSELEVQKTYNDLIAEADKLFETQAYAAATLKYQAALKYKPGEGYPTQQLAVIETLASDLKKQQDQFSRLVAEGDNLFTSKEYQEAKAKYAEATALFPDEEHPKTRIEEINLIMRAANQNAQQEYDKTIAEADKFLAAAAYGQALTSYRNAAALMPGEAYPVDMADKILNILNDNAFRKLLNASKSIQNNEQEKFSFDPLEAGDRKSSILVIRVRGMGIRGFKVFVNYGKGGNKNGGFIMPIPGGEEMKEYVFELGNQYNWTSQDNNWISLTPQGGSIEVTLIEIAKAGVE